MTDPHPEYVWVFPPEKSKKGRVWAISLLAALAIGIAAAVFVMFLRPWDAPAPRPVDTPSASTPPTAPMTPSAPASTPPAPTPTPTPEATESETPAPVPSATATQPPRTDPAVEVFRNKVGPRLDDAATGLTYAQDASGQEGMQLVDQLRNDAAWLSDAVPPHQLAAQWSARTAAYGQALDALHRAFESDAATTKPLSAARTALAGVAQLVAR